MNPKIQQLQKQIQAILLFFMVVLILSGATAIPAYREIRFLLANLPAIPPITDWLQKVFNALESTNNNFPFLLYGYDWLAFAHFVIAIVFIGPLRQPVRNIWVIEFGLIACVAILPYAFLFCALRGIPYWWALIDCSFGVFGFIPLWICRRKIKQLEKVLAAEKLNIVF